MRVTRLSWAGVQLVQNDVTLLIDPLENVVPLAGFLGNPLTDLVSIQPPLGQVYALITHIHPDHYDAQTLRRLLGPSGQVYGPAPVVHKAQEDGLSASTVDLGKTFTLGPFEVTAMPAVDCFGDDQISWVVQSGDAAVFHGGDTIWHGYWWRIAREYGPFDLAFLPINGVIVVHPDFDPSGLPATLTPMQAAIAARLLRASLLCPMHYGTFNNPPSYAEFPDPVSALRTAAVEEGVSVRVLQPEEFIGLS